MPTAVLELFRSKKFITAMVALIAIVGAHFAHMPEERIAEIVGIFAALLLGQGAASFGKEGPAKGPTNVNVASSSEKS